MDSHKINASVEAICNKGCLQVRRDIRNLEKGVPPPEVATLAGPEREQVLQELKAIMAVYGDSCRI